MKKRQAFHDEESCIHQTFLKMKLTVFVVLFSVMGAWASQGYSQNTKLTLDVKNERIEDFLKVIENQSEYRFFYSGKIDVDQRISVDFENREINEVLDKALKGTGIGYEINGRQIILSSVGSGKFTPAQRKVIGKVTDESGVPVPSVSVLVKGTTQGTITDANGNYSLVDVPGDATLIFSFIGMQAQEVEIAGKSSVNVVLRETSVGLEEVVAVGYGTLKKADIATSISSVKPEDFNTGGGRDTRSLLEGKVAGLVVTRTGGSSPNSSVEIQLRGVVSMNGDQEPLVVIDGIPGGNLDLLQADDIESIEVLKDGSAAAIYGSKANAGVILITTKKGKKGENTMEYSTYVTRYFLAKHPDFMDAAEYRTYMEELDDPSYMVDNGASTDFYKALIKNDNLSQSHNISFSGAGNNSSAYRASLYYNDLQGLAKKDERAQYGARVSLQGKAFYDILTYQTNLATNFNNADLLGNEGWESSLSRNPTTPIYNEDGTFFENAATTNPSYVARLYQQKYKRNQQTTSLDGKLTAEPLKNLKFSVFGSSIRDSYVDNVYYDKDSKASVDSYDGGGYAKKSSYLQSKYAMEPTIEYSSTILKDHSVNAIVGYSYQYKVTETLSAENAGFLSDETEENDLGAGSYLTDGNASMSSEKEDETLIAFFGRVNYSYKSKYVAQVSLRHEGSSKFGKNNKWGNFPSASAAWNISHENFMQQFAFLSELKLRVGYGVTGNSGIDPYQSLATLGTGGYYINDDGDWIQTYGPSSNVNNYLKWEKKKETDIGIDYGFLNNRIGGSIDLFNRRTEDLLATANSAVPSLLQSTVMSNVGTITSKGIELSVNATPLRKRDLMWRVDFNGSTLQNKLVKFTNDPDAEYEEYGSIGGFGALGNAIRTYAGDKVGNFFGKRFAGFDDNGDWLFYTKDGEKVSADEISDDDMAVIGNGVPKFYASLSNYIRYKNFDFSIAFRGKFGFDILNRTEMFYGNKTTLEAGFNVLRSVRSKNVDSSYQYSDYYIEKGDFVKLDNITVGYNFKNRSGSKFPDFRVYVTGRDLLTITGYSGLDPEVTDTGLAPGIEWTDRTPLTRSFIMGLNVKF